MSENTVYLLLSFGLLINTAGEATASCSGNSGFQNMSKGIVDNERDRIENRRYKRKKRKITEKKPLLQCY